MNPKYIGDLNIEEVPGAKLVTKRGQASVLTRPFEGNVNDLIAFLAANPLLSTDYQFPSMVLDAIESDWDGPEAKVKLTYYGLPSVQGSNPSNLQSDASWEPRSVTLQTNKPDDGNILVNYYSPTITYRYAVAGRFATPIYQSYSETPSNITILDQKFADTTKTGNIQGTIQYEAFSVCTSFKRNQKGNIYNYAETWAVLIQPPGAPAANAPINGVNFPNEI